MSENLLIGVVGPSFWSYTASIMADHLRHVIEQKATDPDHLLKGVFFSASEFFEGVLEAVGEVISINPCASLANYKIATDAILECTHPQLQNSAQIDDRLLKYSEFLRKLEDKRQLSDDELIVSQEMYQFFIQLEQAGEEETYSEAVGFDLPEVD